MHEGGKTHVTEGRPNRVTASPLEPHCMTGEKSYSDKGSKEGNEKKERKKNLTPYTIRPFGGSVLVTAKKRA